MQLLRFLLPLFLFVFPFCFAEEGEDVEEENVISHTPHKSHTSHSVGAVHRVKPLIILDAGHGGQDEGARVHSFQEKKITLTTALFAKKHLEEMGYRVVMTRSRDVTLSLHRRAAIANKTQGTLFVSIHFNASRAKEAKGIEVFFCNGEEAWKSQASKRLANCILYHVIDQTEATSRGVKEGNFHVIRETQMPAVLVEAGFVTNPDERAQLQTRDYLDLIAKGIAEGVDKYLK
jgi:N-acetylmuramoyl-L-alanine amidase